MEVLFEKLQLGQPACLSTDAQGGGLSIEDFHFQVFLEGLPETSKDGTDPLEVDTDTGVLRSVVDKRRGGSEQLLKMLQKTISECLSKLPEGRRGLVLRKDDLECEVDDDDVPDLFYVQDCPEENNHNWIVSEIVSKADVAIKIFDSTRPHLQKRARMQPSGCLQLQCSVGFMIDPWARIIIKYTKNNSDKEIDMSVLPWQLQTLTLEPFVPGWTISTSEIENAIVYIHTHEDPFLRFVVSKSDVSMDLIGNDALLSLNELGPRAITLSPFLCKWSRCAEAFATQRELVLHAKDHIDSLNWEAKKTLGYSHFKCRWSDCWNRGSFSERMRMLIHMRGHTLEKPYMVCFTFYFFSC